MAYTEVCNEIDAFLKTEEGQAIDTYLDSDALAAYAYNLSLEPTELADWVSDAEEAYAGRFGSDEEFAEDFAESIGALPRETSWPHGYIDWERAAHDLMMDYFEKGGYYFRNL